MNKQEQDNLASHQTRSRQCSWWMGRLDSSLSQRDQSAQEEEAVSMTRYRGNGGPDTAKPPC